MRNYIDSFLSYMKVEKIASPSTIYGYNKELKKFIDYIISENISDINLISTRIIRQYFYYAKENRGLGQSSISKIIATVKSFFNYLEEEDITDIGKILIGEKAGRTSRDQRILFANLGMGCLDITIAERIYQSAKAKGLGQKLSLWEKPLWI